MIKAVFNKNMPAKQIIQVYGHRGARGYFPENTITAFLEALKTGVDFLELDVVISKDHKIVVSHEPWMNELFCAKENGQLVENNSREKYNLYKMPYSEIATFDCGKNGHPQFPLQKKITEHKPLLSEVFEKTLAYAKANNLKAVNYNIEIKTEDGGDTIFQPPPAIFVDLVLAELKNKNMLDKCILQSFDARILNELRKKETSATLAFLVENNNDLENNLQKLNFVPDIYAPEFILVNETLVQQLRSKSIKLLTWTVNEITDIKKMIALKVDGIISDYPDRVIDLLK